VVSEGLIVYLDAEEVAALARDLHDQPSFAAWVFDLVSPWLLRRMRRVWGRALAEGNVEMKFAPPEGTGFFAPFGWAPAEVRATVAEGGRLGRTVPTRPVVRLLTRLMTRKQRETLRNMATIVRLVRQERRGDASGLVQGRVRA
jgi:O-methyltransferase involved in polyketide biosynthesis